ncbi:D-serine ammonia-lyase [Bacillus sp. KH172YL63]|uniref:D-serine ammonia-lyase n=1 Tax=Bacillus sp. KH172YL63 TaxID=2709784 RepID=UPI0013E41DA5|nr:D-serine ammonia-lyase [Bacillus sp. KH172YL63]BCB03916.1 D-serine dehydratase [Bacillus sp. KH172YL63]
MDGLAPQLLEALQGRKETLWTNPSLRRKSSLAPLDGTAIEDAEARLQRFAPFLKEAFPETEEANGLIESDLISIPAMKQAIELHYGTEVRGRLMLKCDHELPIAGSIKARGGIYEVLKLAETLLVENRLTHLTDDYAVLSNERFKSFLGGYSIVVGSTGNLALSIGTIGAALGFRVTVHMSYDAKAWKKDLLRKKGVTVIEHKSDFSQAVEEGRKQSMNDPDAFFIDDEHSKDLFIGYAVAALRLKKQLDQSGIIVDADHPLIVYLPCGVGGGPGGVTYGLKYVFGDHVHCYFAEPVNSPCMLLGLATGKHEGVSVSDIGLSNRTEADGLAVGRPSALAGRMIQHMVNGVYTISDDHLFRMLGLLHRSEGIFLEPSALAGMAGPALPEITGHLHSLSVRKLENATHLVWATGGKLVPEEIRKQYVERGRRSLEK